MQHPDGKTNASDSTNTGSTVSGTEKDDSALTTCTLQQYADCKGLPLDFLRQLDLSDHNYVGKPAVRIPYYGPDGSVVATRFRTALKKADGQDNRFRWRSGDKPKLYGLNRLEEARKAGRVTIVEGESDAQTLWLHGEPALGLPGADTWRGEWADHLADISVVYVVVEPDQGGETVKEKLSKSSMKERVRFVTLGEDKDPSGLYLRDIEGFKAAWQNALKRAVSALEEERTEAEARTKEAWAHCSELAQQPDLIALFGKAIRSRVVGEKSTRREADRVRQLMRLQIERREAK